MADPPFDSFAQNGEDVVLWRALGHIAHGRYVDVGANHPTNDSVTRAFYDHGWRGITIEPDPTFAALLQDERPGDVVIEAAMTSHPNEPTTLHQIPDTGLSTLVDAIGDAHRSAGYEIHDVTISTRTLDDVLAEFEWATDAIHFLSIDVEGSESDVLQGLDLQRWRPWVLVIEAIAPNGNRPTHKDWEKLVCDAGYRFCLFDGLSRFYVADEHFDEIGASLSAPAHVLDNFTTLHEREMAAELEAVQALQRAAVAQSVQWRTVALERWGDRMEDATFAASRTAREHRRLQEEYRALQATLSWRVTKPLRTVRERFPRRPVSE